MSEHPFLVEAQARFDARFPGLKDAFTRHRGLAFFVGGFGFDALTLNRIDAWLDLALQGLYLALLTAAMLLAHREKLGMWRPPPVAASAWRLHPDAIQFLFGGLLSAYAVFYLHSGVNAKSWVFLALVGGILIFNEAEWTQSWLIGPRLALYSFCLASFLIYFVPVLIGRIGDWVFAGSMALAAAAAGGIARAAASWEAGGDPAKRPKALKRLLPWPAAVLALITGLYYLRLVPPVPLSVKFIGIYHGVANRTGTYRLKYEKPGWLSPFLREDDPFRARPGDKVYCFVRVFAPTRFTHEIRLHWLQKDPESGTWLSRDAIPLPIKGGRGSGYRGYAFKTRYTPGKWKVRVETQDGRSMGETKFQLEADTRTGERRWSYQEM